MVELGSFLQLILQTQILIPQIIEFRYLGITQVAVDGETGAGWGD